MNDTEIIYISSDESDNPDQNSEVVDEENTSDNNSEVKCLDNTNNDEGSDDSDNDGSFISQDSEMELYFRKKAIESALRKTDPLKISTPNMSEIGSAESSDVDSNVTPTSEIQDISTVKEETGTETSNTITTQDLITKYENQINQIMVKSKNNDDELKKYLKNLKDIDEKLKSMTKIKMQTIQRINSIKTTKEQLTIKKNQKALTLKSLLDRKKIKSNYLKLSKARSSDLSLNEICNINPKQPVCTDWINDKCVDKFCKFQHLDLVSKSNSKNNQKSQPTRRPIKSINQRGAKLISKLYCNVCDIYYSLDTCHIVDDVYCRECCDKVMSLTIPGQIINQLLVIWHHCLKRLISHRMKTIKFPNSSDDNINEYLLVKVSKAIYAKLVSIFRDDKPSGIYEEHLRAIKHVIYALWETNSSIESIVNCIKEFKYCIPLVIFTKNLNIDLEIRHKLLLDTLNYHIKMHNYSHGLISILQNLSRVSAIINSNGSVTLLGILSNILKQSSDNPQASLFVIELINVLIRDIVGIKYYVLQSISLSGLSLDDTFYEQISDHLIDLWDLCAEYKLFNKMALNDKLVLVKSLICYYFYEGIEEECNYICRKFRHISNVVTVLYQSIRLRNKQSIEFGHSDNDYMVEVSHYCYEKSDWLLNKYGKKKCFHWLEFDVAKQLKSELSDEEFYEHVLYNESNELRLYSPLWMCYMLLLSLKGKFNKINGIIGDFSNAFYQQRRDHFCRSLVFLFSMYTSDIVNQGNSIESSAKLVLCNAKELITECTLFEVVFSMNWSNINTGDLSEFCMYLIDLHQEKHPDTLQEFLVMMVTKLCESTTRMNKMADSIKDVICLIGLIYKPQDERFWMCLLNFMESMSTPTYELIGQCKYGLSNVTRKQSLKLQEKLNSFYKRQF